MNPWVLKDCEVWQEGVKGEAECVNNRRFVKIVQEVHGHGDDGSNDHA